MRYAAISDPRFPKRRTIIKKEFHKDRTNIHAYVRFIDENGAYRAMEANGNVYEGYHLRIELANTEAEEKQRIKKNKLNTTVNITSTDRKIRSRTGEVRKNFGTKPESKKMKNSSDDYQRRTALARKKKRMKFAGPFKNIVKIGTRTKGRFQAMKMRFRRSLENKTLLCEYADRKTKIIKTPQAVKKRICKRVEKKNDKKTQRVHK